MNASDIILETRGLTKEFKGFVAVADVNLKVVRGTIHALIGPNGAGKTTCFNLLTKFLTPTRGQILFNGEDITRDTPEHIARRGIVRSYQISSVFPHLTVLENVRIALQRPTGLSFQFWRSERALDHLNERAMSLLDQVDLRPFASSPTVSLPYGRKRALEIATTLATEPELMLLDEPTQGMGHEDVARVTDANAAKEFYLVDIVNIANADGRHCAVVVTDPQLTLRIEHVDAFADHARTLAEF